MTERACRLLANKKGQALIVAYIIIGCLLVVSAALLSKATTERNLVFRNKLMTEALYLAEGGVENAISTLTNAIANYQVSVNIQTMDVTTNYPTFYNAVVNATITRLEDNDRLLTEGQTNILACNYEITATAVHPRDNNVIVTVHQIISRRLIPTFQHAVFYNDDLEVLPGKSMTLSGRIHANKSIYIDAEGGATLKIDSFYLRSAGGIYNQRKDNDDPLDGNVSIRVTKSGAAKYENMDSGDDTILDSDSANWTTGALDLWKGTVQSSAQGVTKLTAPSVGSIQADGYYASNAGVTIIDEQIYKDGTLLTEGVDYPIDTVTTSTAFYNNREKKTIRMTNVDLKKLAGVVPVGDPACATCTNNLPVNGLLYVTRTDAGATEEPGVKLVSGSELKIPASADGLTIVSDDPVYVQGNYNITNEKPAAIICDSVNLLSSNWNNDTNSTKALSSRKAGETTVNSAFIAGIDETESGKYNGGLENYPRLHENWGGTNLNIKGSFVALWESSIAKGAWKYGSPQYTAPGRNWIYNTSFNNLSNLPPFTPWAVEARRIAWWRD